MDYHIEKEKEQLFNILKDTEDERFIGLLHRFAVVYLYEPNEKATK